MCGTEIGIDRWVSVFDYWMSPPACALFGPTALRVNDEGTGDYPARTFKSTVIGPPLDSYYSRIREFLKGRGCKVYMAGYDWRLGVRAAAEQQWPRIHDFFGGGPVYLVGHSLGGIVGRALMRVAEGLGQLGEVKRLVTLASPHWGTISVVRVWERLNSWYYRLGALFFANKVLRNAFGSSNPFSLNLIDKVVGSFVSTYEMLPQPGSPELLPPYTYDLAMTRSTYEPHAGNLLDQRFTAARDFHTWIQNSIYPDQMLTVVGSNLVTPQQITDPFALTAAVSYSYNHNGDGVVSAAAQQLPGVPKVTVEGVEHFAFPYDRGVLSMLLSLLEFGHD